MTAYASPSPSPSRDAPPRSHANVTKRGGRAKTGFVERLLPGESRVKQRECANRSRRRLCRGLQALERTICCEGRPAVVVNPYDHADPALLIAERPFEAVGYVHRGSWPWAIEASRVEAKLLSRALERVDSKCARLLGSNRLPREEEPQRCCAENDRETEEEPPSHRSISVSGLCPGNGSETLAPDRRGSDRPGPPRSAQLCRASMA